MYGGSGDRPGRLAVEPHAPAALAEMLEQLDRRRSDGPRAAAASAARAPPTRPRRAARAAAPRRAATLDRDPRRHDPRVVHDRERLGRQLVRQVAEDAVRGRRRSHGRRRAAATRRAARPDAARSAPAAGRSRARARPSDADASFGSMDELREALRDGAARGGGADLAPARRGEGALEQRGPPARAARADARRRAATPASTTWPCSSSC